MSGKSIIALVNILLLKNGEAEAKLLWVEGGVENEEKEKAHKDNFSRNLVVKRQRKIEW